jgi:hypothetical protein
MGMPTMTSVASLHWQSTIWKTVSNKANDVALYVFYSLEFAYQIVRQPARLTKATKDSSVSRIVSGQVKQHTGAVKPTGQ